MRPALAAALACALLLASACHRHGQARCRPGGFDDRRCLQRAVCPLRDGSVRLAPVPTPDARLTVIALDTNGAGVRGAAGWPVRFATLLVAAVPEPAPGQSPLAGLPPKHLGWGRPVVGRAETDSLGIAHLARLSPGPYVIVLRRVGYNSMTFPFRVRPGFADTLRLHPDGASNCP